MGARHYRTNRDPVQEELPGIRTKPHPQTDELRWGLKLRRSAIFAGQRATGFIRMNPVARR